MPPRSEWQYGLKLAGVRTLWQFHITASSSEAERSSLNFSRRLLQRIPQNRVPAAIEAFLESHPKALKFLQDSKRVPVSFATESFFSNNALVFVNDKEEKRAGRYQIVPVNGSEYLSEAAESAKGSNFLREELADRVANAPVHFRLLLQLAGPRDKTSDGSVVWPGTRKKVELGIISITSVVPDQIVAERHLAFDPTRLADGIDLSDDPLPVLRSRVYIYSAAGRVTDR